MSRGRQCGASAVEALAQAARSPARIEARVGVVASRSINVNKIGRATVLWRLPCPFRLQVDSASIACRVGAHQRYRTKHGKRVFRNMRPGAPMAISNVSPPSVSQSAEFSSDPLNSASREIRLGMLAERMDILHAQCLGGGSRKLNWSLSRLRIAWPPGTSPSKIRPCRGDLLDALEIAEMGSRDRRDDRPHAAAHLDQRPDLVGWFIPTSNMPKSVS